MTLRILLVDDHAALRRSLARLLERQPTHPLVTEAADGEGALARLATLAAGPPSDFPQLMLIDVDMPGIGGIEATRRARATYPRLRVLAMSMHDDPLLVDAMAAAGASGYVRKDEPLDHLLRAIGAAVAACDAFRRPPG